MGSSPGPVGQPEGMGRVECFHRSLKEECLQYEDIESLEELNTVLESFRNHYTTQRPHQALGYQTPLEVIQAALKTGIV